MIKFSKNNVRLSHKLVNSVRFEYQKFQFGLFWKDLKLKMLVYFTYGH
jgi:hypothetical protein